MRVQGQLGLCAEFQASLDLHKEENPLQRVGQRKVIEVIEARVLGGETET